MKMLKKVYVEITNVCNLSCDFCPGTYRVPAFMGVAEFEAILKKLSGFTEYLYFHVMGEPLLHPEVVHFLELCAVYGYKVNVTTNGLLIGERSEAFIKSQALRQVNFSLHSQEKTADAEMLEKYLADIFDFTDRALKDGRIYISYRLWNLTSEAAGQYNTFILQMLEQRFKLNFSIREILCCTNRVKLCEGLFLNVEKVFQWPSMSADEYGNKGFCLGLRNQAAVLVDGTVVPCCLDSSGIIKLGNILEDDFRHILYGERAKALYRGFSERLAVEELCRKCGYRTRFKMEDDT